MTASRSLFVTLGCDPDLSTSLLRTTRRRADLMGMPAPAQTYYTVDEVLAFPEDGNKYELIFG